MSNNSGLIESWMRGGCVRSTSSIKFPRIFREWCMRIIRYHGSQGKSREATKDYKFSLILSSCCKSREATRGKVVLLKTFEQTFESGYRN